MMFLLSAFAMSMKIGKVPHSEDALMFQNAVEIQFLKLLPLLLIKSDPDTPDSKKYARYIPVRG